MNKPRQSVRLRDVASKAGVSAGTASAAFSGKQWVSEGTREAVWTAATELGYRPRRRASDEARMDGPGMIGLAAQSGLVGPEFRLNNPFYSHVLHGAQRACAELGTSLAYEVLEAQELPLMVRHRQVEGLLLMGHASPDFIEKMARSGIPLVTVVDRIDVAGVDSVSADDERGGYEATRYLIGRGHRVPAPAIIVGPQQNSSARDRLAGYRRALAEYGVAPEGGYVRQGDFSLESGLAQTRALLDLPAAPTAVFCCNDQMALGALAALRERGIEAPQGCSVVGYDDVDMAANAVPALTTIAVEKGMLGAQGVWHLVERIRHPQLPRRETRIGVSLVERDSVSARQEAPSMDGREARSPGLERDS